MCLEYSEIESIERVGVEDVYDISIDGDNHSFIANGIIVHNCNMRNLLKDLALKSQLTFDDISAATALYRPGPIQSGMLDEYVGIKQGEREVHYMHNNTKDALKDTLGVMIYQESVMKISQDVAGYSMIEADKLRKIMGKKMPEEMAKQHDKFVNGCIEYSGMSEREAVRLFEMIDKFAGYGFNKSHSVAYSIISFMSMWVKVYYPAEFFAAALTIAKDEKVKAIVIDALSKGFNLYPPDVNRSSDEFEVVINEGKEGLLIPFNRIRGVSDKGCASLMEGRKNHGKDFTTRDQVLNSVNKRSCNKRVQDALDKIGSFAYHPINDGIDPMDSSRLKDQIYYLPNIIIENVTSDNVMKIDDKTEVELLTMFGDIERCEACELKNSEHPEPHIGRDLKFMIITDCPNFFEAKAGKMMDSGKGNYILKAMKQSGLKKEWGYNTALVKAPKSKGSSLSKVSLRECTHFIDKEIELLKPPIIIACGSNSARHMIKGLKGSMDEHNGSVHYIPEIDANVVLTINPQSIFVVPEKQDMLNEAFEIVAELVSQSK